MSFRSLARPVVRWALLLALIAPAPLLASERTAAPTVRGVVTDTTGRPISNVTVSISSLRRVTTTGPEGRFVFDGLPPGRHHLDAMLLGYSRTDVEVDLPAAGPDVNVTIVMRQTPLRLTSVVVTATPGGADALGITQSTVDLAGKELARTLTSSVARTLEGEAGMATRYNGPAATMPVIRGLTGDRIVVLQDGERSADLASSAPDHGLTIDPLSADRIEVIRGPASLLYGTSALGGVVNVISNDIPTSVPTHISGSIGATGESVAPGGGVSGTMDIPIAGRVTAALAAGFRNAKDVRMGNGLELFNSDSKNAHASAGLSVVGSRGSAGLSFKTYDLDYGIPAAPDEAEAGVRIDGKRDQVSVRGDLSGSGGMLQQLAFNGSAQRYRQGEVEPSGEIGTRFNLETQTVGLTAKTKVGRVDGAIGAMGLFRQYRAVGEEALTPPANTRNIGLFVYQDVALASADDHHGPRLQLGARYDLFGIDSKAGDAKFGAPRSRDFNSGSGSIGLTFPLTSAMSLGVSAARAFRAPAVEELFSNGVHAATGTFDVGDADLASETTTGVDAVFRVQNAHVNLQLSAYVSRIGNFIAPGISGDTLVDGEEGPERMPLNRFMQRDAAMRGLEASIEGTPAKHVVVGAMADLVRGSFDGGGVVPFIPAARVGAHGRWDNGRLSVGAELRRGFAQDRVSGGEVDVPTEAFTLGAVSAGWTIIRGGLLHTITLRADNVFDTPYRDATSWIKRYAFNPGRNVAVVYRVLF